MTGRRVGTARGSKRRETLADPAPHLTRIRRVFLWVSQLLSRYLAWLSERCFRVLPHCARPGNARRRRRRPDRESSPQRGDHPDSYHYRARRNRRSSAPRIFSAQYHRMFEVRHLINYTPQLSSLGFQPIVKSGHDVGGAHPAPPEISQTSPAIDRKRFRRRQKLEGGQYER